MTQEAQENCAEFDTGTCSVGFVLSPLLIQPSPCGTQAPLCPWHPGSPSNQACPCPTLTMHQNFRQWQGSTRKHLVQGKKQSVLGLSGEHPAHRTAALPAPHQPLRKLCPGKYQMSLPSSHFPLYLASCCPCVDY